MKFEIRHAVNGVILRVETDAPEAAVDEVVYQEREDDEIAAFAEFLRHLLDHYGPSTSRYSPKRIYVVVEPGDKYEPPEQSTAAPQAAATEPVCGGWEGRVESMGVSEYGRCGTAGVSTTPRLPASQDKPPDKKACCTEN